MSAEANAASTFIYFAKLPAEIRIQIWREALPDQDPPALGFYETGCWQFRRLMSSDEGYEENEDLNLCLEYHHEKLCHIEVKIPLAFANQESRDVAIDWAHKQNIEVQAKTEGQELLFTRPFDPERDWLYVAQGKWNEFLSECLERPWKPDVVADILEKDFTSMSADVKRIVVPEMLFKMEPPAIAESFGFEFANVRTVHYTSNVPHSIELERKDQGVLPRWELEYVKGPVFSWNAEQSRLDFEDTGEDCDPILQRGIEVFLKDFHDQENDRILYVRPIAVVRK